MTILLKRISSKNVGIKIHIMRVGAITILLGILLSAFSMGVGLDLAIVWGVILSVIGLITYIIGIIIGYFGSFEPATINLEPRKGSSHTSSLDTENKEPEIPDYHSSHITELIENLDIARDIAVNIASTLSIAAALSGQMQSPPVNPPAIASHPSLAAEIDVQVRVTQQREKAISGAPPQSNEPSVQTTPKVVAHPTHQAEVAMTSLTREHSNDTNKNIDEEFEQLDMMGAIGGSKESSHTEEEEKDEHDLS